MKDPAVLFDLGDVLVHLRMERGLADFYAGPLADALAAGQLSPEAFFARVGRERGVDVSYEVAAAAWCDIFDRWPEMEELAGQVIDAGHPAYLLSNTDPLHFGLLKGRMPVLSRFSGWHLSYEVGLLKPDPRFFEGALERFGLAAAQTCFVDDRPANVEAARALGIPSFQHRGDPGEVRAFLAAQGVGGLMS